MPDYGKKKNDELAALCKERGLPHTGKKAELVKRLEDYDASTNDGAEIEETAPVANSQNEVPAESNDATESQKAAGAAVAVSTEEPAPEASEEHPPAQDFSLGLQERTLDEEIEKRRKRAEKFGLDPKQDETLKQLERAKRFGTNNLPGLLNQALPERAEKHSKKRGREGKEDGKDNRKRSRQRTAQDTKGEKPVKASGNDGSFPSWMTEKDREAAERRKAKFGATKE